MLFDDVRAAAISRFHDQCNASPVSTAPNKNTSGAWEFIELNHRCNLLLWAEEDLARRTEVADSEIAANKRAIDRFNQQRNDAIERLDEIILQRISQIALRRNARLHSETVGAMIDRLSIMSLKIHHMRLQTQRADVSPLHVEQCNEKLSRLIAQRDDLKACLDALLSDMERGDAYYKIYRQFKMYNDPSLNPYLRGKLL